MEHSNRQNSYLTLGSLNICGQSGLNLVKQKQIEDFISSYRLDILACQEINVEDEKGDPIPMQILFISWEFSPNSESSYRIIGGLTKFIVFFTCICFKIDTLA